MKRVLNFIFILLTAVLMIVLMQLSLLFLKDNISSIVLEKGEYILEMLNRFEREALLNERDSLLRLLDSLISDKNTAKNNPKLAVEINAKIENVNKKLVETNQRIDVNVNEQKVIQTAIKETSEEKDTNIVEELFKKNQENLTLKIKAEVATKELKDEITKKNESNDALKNKLLEIHKDNPKMIKSIENAFTNKKETDIILNELNKMDQIVNFDKKNIETLEENFPKLFSDKGVIDSIKKSDSEKSSDIAFDELSDIISSMESIIEKNYRTNLSLYNDYVTGKRKYESSKKQSTYLSLLSD
ncbi:MAG TPA: hypothetical protein PK771_14825, partial [Spirochaetota bacterium]|nr:hypothetical protein [Spirochaetota bacterium]